MAPTYLGPDDFHFLPIGTEEITRYVPGGYHPVIIGDVLRSRPGGSSYRVLHKLGFGSYATVWMAEQVEHPRAIVAVKVTTSEDRSGNEAKFLRLAQKNPSPHIVFLIDDFDIRGPNGLHSVLVTDLLIPALPLFASPRTSRWRKKIAYDVAMGLTYLHASGVVHGDLHLGNVGIVPPRLSAQATEDILQDLTPYDMTVVLPVDASKSTSSLPTYMVAPCNMVAYYDKLQCGAAADDPQAKIFDFGSVRLPGSSPMAFQCANEACAPETVLARTVNKVDNPIIETPADVWALGALIYELMSGTPLFNVGMGALLSHMHEMAGDLPPHWISQWPHPQLSTPDPDEWWEAKRHQLSKHCPDSEDTECLIRMLRKALVLDPTKRLSAASICRDSWFDEFRTHPPVKDLEDTAV